jgi:hypothetical protein
MLEQTLRYFCEKPLTLPSSIPESRFFRRNIQKPEPLFSVRGRDTQIDLHDQYDRRVPPPNPQGDQNKRRVQVHTSRLNFSEIFNIESHFYTFGKKVYNSCTIFHHYSKKTHYSCLKSLKFSF